MAVPHDRHLLHNEATGLQRPARSLPGSSNERPYCVWFSEEKQTKTGEAGLPTLGESGIQQPGRRDVRKGVSDSCIHSESDSALSLHIPELVVTQDTKIWACDLGSLFKTAGFCNNCSWIVTFKNCIKI